MVGVRLTRGLIGICAETLAEVYITVLVMSTWGVIVNFLDVRAEPGFETDASFVVRTDVIVRRGRDTLDRTLNAVVADFGSSIDAYANMWLPLTPVLESITSS